MMSSEARLQKRVIISFHYGIIISRYGTAQTNFKKFLFILLSNYVMGNKNRLYRIKILNGIWEFIFTKEISPLRFRELFIMKRRYTKGSFYN